MGIAPQIHQPGLLHAHQIRFGAEALRGFRDAALSREGGAERQIVAHGRVLRGVAGGEPSRGGGRAGRRRDPAPQRRHG